MKNGKAKLAPGDAFVKLTRDLVESPALQRLSVNACRFIFFLIREHLRHGGKENCRLKAPHRQLIEYGISAGLVTSAIKESEDTGLVECHRGGMRVATLYGLTWLPRHDGTMPPARWKSSTAQDQKSATTSGGRAASTSGGRWPKSASTPGGRSRQKSATTSGGAI
jgi:hypothetical protein